VLVEPFILPQLPHRGYSNALRNDQAPIASLLRSTIAADFVHDLIS